MIVIDTYCGRLDEAMCRGFDPHDPDVDVPGPPLSPEWQAALDGAVVEARALRAAGRAVTS